MMQDRLGANTLVIQLPIGAEGDFAGVIDLVLNKALVWPLDDDSLGATFTVQDIPADLADQAAEYRSMMLEEVATADDDLMEKYLADEELSVEEIKAAIRKGTIAGQFVPVLCGTAFKNKGVQPMLDAVVDFLPSPLDIPATKGTEIGRAHV